MVSSQPLSAPSDSISAPSDLDRRSPNQQLMPLTATVNDQDHLEVGGLYHGSGAGVRSERTRDRRCFSWEEDTGSFVPVRLIDFEEILGNFSIFFEDFVDFL